jgi:actin-like ATPase involved in cell morphogenesis
MVGKTPAHIQAVKPLVDGVISDFEITEKMLKHFINKVHGEGFSFLPRPRVIIGIPLDITEVEKKAVEDAAKSAGARKVYLIEEVMAAALGAGLPVDSPRANMIVDIGGGTTDIAVVNDGGVEGTKMFGIGGRSFTRTISSELDLSFSDAEKLKLNIDDERIKPTVAEDVNAAIDKTLEVWIAGVELALSEFDSADHLPNRILLCGGGSSLNKLVDELQKTDWHKDLPFTKKPTVHHIKPSEVAGITDKTGLVNDHTFITAMGLLRVGYDTIIGSSDADSIKEKLNRILRI